MNERKRGKIASYFEEAFVVVPLLPTFHVDPGTRKYVFPSLSPRPLTDFIFFIIRVFPFKKKTTFSTIARREELRSDGFQVSAASTTIFLSVFLSFGFSFFLRRAQQQQKSLSSNEGCPTMTTKVKERQRTKSHCSSSSNNNNNNNRIEKMRPELCGGSSSAFHFLRSEPARGLPAPSPHTSTQL